MKEKEIQKDVLKALQSHPKVAWAYITSAGVAKGVTGGRPFRIGFNGLSDILGQMTDGKFLAIEVKQPGKEPTPEQYEFLTKVNADGGVGFWVYSIEQVSQIMNNLETLKAGAEQGLKFRPETK